MTSGDVVFTKYSCRAGGAGGAGFGKRVWLEGAGAGAVLRKEAVVSLVEGYYETVRMPWRDFGGWLAGVGVGEALGYGVVKKPGAGERGMLITKAAEVAGREGVAKTLTNFGWPEYGVLMFDVDDLEVLRFGSGSGSRGASVREVGLKVLSALELAGVLALSRESGFDGAWAVASAGANIWKVGEGVEVVGLSGVHVYIGMDFRKLAEKGGAAWLKEVVKQVEWRLGWGHWKLLEHRYGVSVLERGGLDWSVWSPERFDFIGGVECGEGLEQRRAGAEWLGLGLGELGLGEGGEGDWEGDWAEVRLNAHRAAKEAAEARRAELIVEGKIELGGGGVSVGEDGVVELSGEVELVSDDGRRVRGWELIFFPERWHGCGFHDVLRPDKGPGKARFYWNGGHGGAAGAGAGASWELVLNSFVGGGVKYVFVLRGRDWKLMLDGAVGAGMVNGMDDIRERLEEGGRWWTLLARMPVSAVEDVLALLKERKLCGKGEARAKLEGVAEVVAAERAGGLLEAALEERARKLEDMNRRWAYVRVGGKGCYLDCAGLEKLRGGGGGGGGGRGGGGNGEGGGLGGLFLRRPDFLAEVENEGEVVAVSEGGEGEALWTAKGSLKTVPVGDAWLEWKGRREYSGIEFKPGLLASEFDGVLNWWSGWGDGIGYSGGRAPGERACGGVVCGGVGCLRWAVDELVAGREGVCEGGAGGAGGAGGGWTRWVRTIWDICGGKDAALWILDWFADMIQDPMGEGGGRQVALVLRGGQGTGKNTIIDAVGRLLGDHTFTATDMSVITGRFNGFLAGCLMLFCNEAIWGGNRKEGNKLKDIIDGEYVGIEKKGVDIVRLRNYVRLAVASNSEWVIPAEADERRYTVIEVSDTWKENREWFALVRQGESVDLLWELLRFSGGSNIRFSLKTEALEAQKLLSQDEVSEMLALAVEESWFWQDDESEGFFTSESFKERIEATMGRFILAEGLKKKMLLRVRGKGGRTHRTKVKLGGKWLNGYSIPNLKWFQTWVLTV